MNQRQVRNEAIRRSEHWWYCDNILNHPGQIGLLRMDFPRVFILVRDDNDLVCEFEHFRDSIAELNFFNPSDREDADTEEILIDAWNFLSLIEEEEERQYDIHNGYEDDELNF